MQVCHVLIDEPAVEIRAGIEPLLAADALDDLRRVFAQLRSLPRGTEHMRSALRSHILTVANDALDAVTTAHPAGGKAYVDAWVTTVLAVHHKFAEMAEDVFEGDQARPAPPSSRDDKTTLHRVMDAT